MTLGLVGYGHAGRLVAEKAKAFGMNLLFYDPYVDMESIPEYIAYAHFDELLQQADIISLHCVATPQTQGMFAKEQFMRMKRGSYFINTSRGELVIEKDLIEALNCNHLAGAAIDVTAVEPISSDSPLLDVKNLVITPHIAGSSYDVQVQGSHMIYDSLIKWIEGEKPSNCVVYC